MTHIKVCCIASQQEADLALAAGADALGLVAEMPSGPGTIDDAQIRRIASHCPPGVSTFLLTCRREADDIISHITACGTNTVQLVDAVAPGAHEKIRNSLPHIKIVQVIHVLQEESIDDARRCAETADVLLLDSGNPGLAVKELGGTGRTHNWEISRRIVEAVDCPVYLAGGLTPENVARAIDSVRPFGVDVCSGLRTDGRLDRQKLDLYCDSVRRA